ncbi:MAG: ABC transporter ATP-binding protein [Oscillochloridaceae bacterium umkhey_bin13]
MSATAIEVHGLAKRFERRGARPSTLKELLLRGFRNRAATSFWGLRDVSFQVAPGRMVGIIGPNGAGKSTLLRLIGGVGLPDRGRVQTHGRIGALLDLGSGLEPDLTGRENVFIAGVISGMLRREVAERFDEIVAFAELEDFIDSPLRTYSSGMQMRLAFAVAAHIDPQILLIDEVLAVGDLAFQRKCMDRIARFKQQGCTILLVSHDPSQIRSLCDEVIWLRHGEVVSHGPTEQVLEAYIASMDVTTRERTPTNLPTVDLGDGRTLQINQNRFGSQEIQITQVRLLSLQGTPISQIQGGAGLVVEFAYQATNPITEPIASVSVSRADGQICFDLNTDEAGVALPELVGTGWLRLQIDRLDLAGGEYFVNVGLYEHDWTYTYDFHWQVYSLEIIAARPTHGDLRPPFRWDIALGQAADTPDQTALRS